MKKLIIVFMFFNCFILILKAQNSILENVKRPKGSINLCLYGDASLYSLQYDNLIPLMSNLIFSQKLGVGFNENPQICLFGSCSDPRSFITVPHHLTLNFGKKRHFLETGVGGTYMFGKTTKPYLLYPIIGYRLIPFNQNNINIRFFTHLPAIHSNADIWFIPFGFSFGVSY